MKKEEEETNGENREIIGNEKCSIESVHFLYLNAADSLPVSYRSSRYFERESMFFWHQVLPAFAEAK